MVKAMETVEEFDAVISSAGDTLVLVDFYADWCGPCRKIAPTLQTWSETEFDYVKFIKVNVDQLEELTAKYKVTAMPTFLLFKKGEIVATVVGASEAKIREALVKNK